MKIIKRIVVFLNPGQGDVIAGGQPVYALRKKVQLMYPSHYNGIAWMMSPLHIDFYWLFLVLLGTDWKWVVRQSY